GVGDVACINCGLYVAYDLVVDTQTAALDLPSRFARRGGEARQLCERRHSQSQLKLGSLDLEGRKAFRNNALFERSPRGLGGIVRSGPSMQDRSCLGCENFFRNV